MLGVEPGVHICQASLYQCAKLPTSELFCKAGVTLNVLPRPFPPPQEKCYHSKIPGGLGVKLSDRALFLLCPGPGLCSVLGPKGKKSKEVGGGKSDFISAFHYFFFFLLRF